MKTRQTDISELQNKYQRVKNLVDNDDVHLAERVKLKTYEVGRRVETTDKWWCD